MTRTTRNSIFTAPIVRGTSICGACLLLAGLTVYACYLADRVVLREIATGIVEDTSSPADQVLAVNSWVHWHNKFIANQQSYLFAPLRATPLQIVDDGGDCADKSRLVVALLTEIDIPATPVMCFDPATGRPVHTVVEAQIGDDAYMVVDPSFDLFFQKDDAGEYYGLLELKSDPTILPARLHAITSSRDYWMRVNGYRQDRSVYDLASTFNWNKNMATRIMRSSLVSVMGDDVDRIRRPRVMEEPKLAVACAGILAGAGMLACSATMARRSTRNQIRIAQKVKSSSRTAVHPSSRGRRLVRDGLKRKPTELV